MCAGGSRCRCALVVKQAALTLCAAAQPWPVLVQQQISGSIHATNMSVSVRFLALGFGRQVKDVVPEASVGECRLAPTSRLWGPGTAQARELLPVCLPACSRSACLHLLTWWATA